MGVQQEVLFLPCESAALRRQDGYQDEAEVPFRSHVAMQIGRYDAAALGQREGDHNQAVHDQGGDIQFLHRFGIAIRR